MSCSRRRLASSDWPPTVDTKLPRLLSQACSVMHQWMRSASAHPAITGERGDFMFLERGPGVHGVHRRGVRCQPQHEAAAFVADVVAARGRPCRRAPVVEGRPEAQPDPGTAGQPPHSTDEHHRAEGAAMLAEPRHHVGDLDGAAVPIDEPRDEDWRVGDVLLFGRYSIDQVDGEEARSAVRGSRSEQKTGSPSKPGAEHQTTVPSPETRALVVPLPTMARSRVFMTSSLSPGVGLARVPADPARARRARPGRSGAASRPLSGRDRP